MADGVTVPVGSAAIEERSDLGTDAGALVRFWKGQLELAERTDRDWIDRGRLIVKRYRDERGAVNSGREVRYNILWSNVETLKPVLYGRTPKPDVSRRQRDQNQPVAQMGADILERCLEWSDDIEELDTVMKAVVEDRLLPGRGVARVFYEAEFGDEEEDPDAPDQAPGGDEVAANGAPPRNPPGEDGEDQDEDEDEDEDEDDDAWGEDEDGEAAGPGGQVTNLPAARPRQTFRPVTNERAPVRYVFWEDYRESPARTEDEITWKAYRSFMTRDQLTERFGAKGKDVELDWTPSGFAPQDGDSGGPAPDSFKKASVWEIWDRSKREVVWLAQKATDAPLDRQPDPYELPGFFPSPPCLRATTTNNTRVPVADWVEYQDQGLELDNISSRIDRLVRALKVAGVYAGSEKATLQKLVDDSSENQLIPVEDWAGFAGDKGGLQNLIQWLPVQQIADVLIRLYDARERILAIIYQTTGIADILRGETDPNETLGAQRLKTRFATRRITQSQSDVGRFAGDLMKLRGSVIARHFSPETLARMSGLPEPLPALPPPPPMLVPAPQSPAQPGGAPVPPMGGPQSSPIAGPPAAVPFPAHPAPRPGLGATRAPINARLAPDGRHYVPDPRRPGKFLMVV